jgi:putative transposase
LTGKIAAFVEQEDHAHLFGSSPPSVAPSQIAHTLKETTARHVFQRFPEVKKQLWGGAFWSRPYYGGSVGDMSVDAVLKYIGLGQD